MIRIACLTLCLAVPLAAHAQDPDYVPEKTTMDKVKAEGDEKKDGWKIDLSLGFNGSLSDSQSVVGTDDGTTIQIGLALGGKANLRAGDHEWLNTLDITHSQSRTPAIPEFVKSSDSLELRTIYLYRIPSVPWLGPFARGRLQTALFSGQLVVPDPAAPILVDGVATELDTNAIEQDDGPDIVYGSLPLTDPFKPLVLRESAGFFALPVEKEVLKLTISLGAGAQQIFAEGCDGGCRAVADDPATPEIEISTLSDSQQVGLEVEVEAAGAATEMVTYSLRVNTLTPFYSDPETAGVGAEGETLEGPVDLTNIDISGRVGVKLAKWASLDYVLTAKYLPLVIAEWQVTNSLLLNASFNLL